MPPDTAAQKACSYILNRIQTDPDLRWIAGPLTETFHLLCAAEAEYTGRPIAEIEKARAEDLQPPYRKRRPEVVELRDRLLAEEERLKLTGDALHAEGEVSRLRNALEQVKSALGDRLLGQGPLSKEYAHGVMGTINDALRAAGRMP